MQLDSHILLSSLSEQLSSHAGALAMRPLGDHRDALLGDEVVEYERAASTSRRMQFSTGRHCVRLCQDLTGVSRRALARQGRVPIWPDGYAGSISHSQHHAVAVISNGLHGIGVDLESANRLKDKPRLWQRLFRADEAQQWPVMNDVDTYTLAFAAKEAGYKAIFPLGQTYIGFSEVGVILQPDGRFTFRYFGNHPINRQLEDGQGYWQQTQDHVIAVFVIE